MKRTAKSIGADGETLAVEYLKSKGYLIHTTNYRGRFGEIDIVAEKDGVLAFVEVKTRSSDRFGRPCEYVDAAKQQRIIAASEEYIYYNETDLCLRFDVIEVYLRPTGDLSGAMIRHIENAFEVPYGSV